MTTGLTPSELQKMRAFQARKQKRLNRRHRDLLAKAGKDFQRIVAMIIEKYQPGRIYQWGSLMDEGRFRSYSDIDIAVEGITDPQTFFALLDDADRLTEFPVDIVMMETIHPLHAKSIRSKGKIVYEKK